MMAFVGGKKKLDFFEKWHILPIVTKDIVSPLLISVTLQPKMMSVCVRGCVDFRQNLT